MLYALVASIICAINFLWWAHLVHKTKHDLLAAEVHYLTTKQYKAHLKAYAYEVKLNRQQLWQEFWGILGFLCATTGGCLYFG